MRTSGCRQRAILPGRYSYLVAEGQKPMNGLSNRLLIGEDAINYFIFNLTCHGCRSDTSVRNC